LRREWRVFKKARTHITKAATIIYRSTKSDCAQCPMKNRCCPNTPIRKIARSIYEPSRNVARRISTTALYRRSRRKRKKVEVLFAHLKRILKLDDFGCVDSAVPTMNSHWRLSRRTCVALPH